MCMITVVILLMKAWSALSVKLDLVNCGTDKEADVATGSVDISLYPWVGILYYTNYGESGEMRATTTVVLIQEEFVVAPAADIGRMPKHNFRKNSRVLLGEDWTGDPRKVRSYVLHPEYGETYNTLAIIQLRDPVRQTPHSNIKPVCPPPDLLRNPKFYVIRFKDDYNMLQKEVIPVQHVPGSLCRDFYIAANLYSKKMRPPHVACATSQTQSQPCVWDAGAVLAARDVWGRWMLLGVGVRGPGCGAPSRFLDMMTYYPWIESSLGKAARITISRIHRQKYVIRSSDGSGRAILRFGNCDDEEQRNLIYRELIFLKTDNNQYQFLTYNMTIVDSVEYTCMTMEMVNATASSEVRITHNCPRESYAPPCHYYRNSAFDLSVLLMFSDSCRFEMYAWGEKKEMKLLDIQEWKWEEGTYYEDFSLTRVEYRGTVEETGFGFEPIDSRLWVPDYDIWTTTEFNNNTTTEDDTPRDGFDNSKEEKPKDDDFKETKGKGTTFNDTSEPESDFLFGMRWK